MSYNATVYREQGSTSLVVVTGGEVRFEGSGVINDTGKWDDIRVPANAVKLAGLQDPGFSAFTGGISTYWFDHSIEESIYFAAQIPHDAKSYANLHPHIHWCATGASTANVRWALEYSFGQIGSTMSAATTLHTTCSPTGNRLHEVTEFDGEIDLSTSASSDVSGMFLCRLFRDSSDAADTFAADAAFLEFDFHYQKGRLGSTGEYS